MAIRTVVTRGYASGGAIKFVVTRGYKSAAIAVVTADRFVGFIANMGRLLIRMG
jgi:hypothetical protein